MPSLNMRAFIKSILPRPIRRAIRMFLNFCSRIAIWPIILWQVRGIAWKDRFVLLISATGSPYFSLFNLMEWQDPILLFDASVRVRGVGKFYIRKRSDDLYHVTPWREKMVLKTVSNTLKNGDVFIDAGANIGLYTVLASRLVGSCGRVICFEMMPDTMAQLEKNIQINNISNVTVISKALSDISGQEIVASVEPGRFGRASISAIHPDANNVSVTTVALDDACSDIGDVRLMKMDIEGSEFRALLGAKELLNRLSGVIYEKWSSELNSEDKIGNLLIEKFFVLKQIDASNYLAKKSLT